MTTNKFYKSANSFMCINFPQKMGQMIEDAYNDNLKSIHIMVFNTNDISERTLEGIINVCKRKHIHLIIHCFKYSDRQILRKKFKYITKNKYFHFQLIHKFIFAFSSEKRIIVKHNYLRLEKLISDETSLQSEIQEIQFK